MDFLKKLGWKTLAEVGSRALSLLFFVALARLLGESAFGSYSIPLALAGLLAIFLDWGSNALMIRELARAPEQAPRLVFQVLALKLLASTSFGLALLITYLTLASPPPASWLLAAGVIWLGQAWLETLCAWLNAGQRFATEARLRLSYRLGVLLPQMLVLLLQHSSHPKQALVGPLLAAAAWSQLLLLPLGWRLLQRFQLRLQVNWQGFGQLFQQGWGFWLANVSWLLYLKLDLAMLPLLGRPAAELGHYQAAVRFYELLGLVGYLVSMTLFPQLAQLALQPSAFWQAVRRYRPWALGAGVALATLGALLSPWLLPLLLGPGFAPAGQLLALLSLSAPFVLLNQIGFNLLGALGLQNRMALATALCLLLNACLNLWSIPHYGAWGAAASTLAADSLLCLLITLLLHQASQSPKN